MAYQDISTPAQVLIREMQLTRSFLSNIGSFFSRMGHAMAKNSVGQARVDLVQSLQAKSDDELAALKIKRDDIVHHVFRDLYYL
jgi:hypothetical protein